MLVCGGLHIPHRFALQTGICIYGVMIVTQSECLNMPE